MKREYHVPAVCPLRLLSTACHTSHMRHKVIVLVPIDVRNETQRAASFVAQAIFEGYGSMKN